MRVIFEDVQSTVCEDLAVLSAFARYAVVAADGTENHVMHNRISWALRHGAEGWKIVHEHTSVPVGYEDAKAILQRP